MANKNGAIDSPKNFMLRVKMDKDILDKLMNKQREKLNRSICKKHS